MRLHESVIEIACDRVNANVCVFSLCVYEYKSVQEYVWVSVQECVMGGRVYDVNLWEWESDFEC